MRLLRSHGGSGRGAGLARPATWSRPVRLGLVLCLALGTTLAQQGASNSTSKPEAAGLRRTRLHAIVSSRVITNVNRNDAVASLAIWFEMVGKEKGYLLDTKVDVVDSAAEVRQRLESHSVDILLLDFVDYLQVEGSKLIVPDLVSDRSERGGPRFSYVLLVNPASRATTIGGLRGTHLSYFSSSASGAALAWIEVVLEKQKLGRAAAFFATTTNSVKPQACVLSLFFGKVDACVVDEVNLELLKEMNPQLGKLRMLARSAPLIDALIATPVEPHPYRQDLLNGGMALQQSPRGRQLLTVFKSTRLVRITPGDMEAARALWSEYRRITGSLPSAAPGPAPFPTATTPVKAAYEARTGRKN